MKKFKFFLALFAAVCLIAAMAVSCGTKKLARPAQLVLDETNQLNWDAVENARGYKLEIVNCDDGNRQEPTPRIPRYSLAGLGEGDYEIRVKAVGNGTTYKDSDWSETVYFHKDYETGCVYKPINNDTEYVIEKVGMASGSIVIEDIYRGKPVTGISANAFKNSGRVEEIVIGGNVTYIGDEAFYNCSNLVSVTIPDSVTEIGEAAFHTCGMLQTVNIPKYVTEIKQHTFAHCHSLETIDLGDKITSVGPSAFFECAQLKEIVIPDSVVSIGEYAFSGNTALMKATFGSGLETIDRNAFFGCGSLENIVFDAESSLTTIGYEAFSQCKSLSEIALPAGLRSLDTQSFFACDALEVIQIPDSVSHIGASAFAQTALYRAAESAGEKYIYIDKWLVDCASSVKETLTAIDASTLKNGVGGIADYVFFGCENLQTVTLPESLKYIGNYAFYDSKKLWKLESYGALELIGERAFSYCELLNRVILGEGLKTIGAYAFYGCTRLDNSALEDSKLIPDTVTSVGAYAFKNTALWNKPSESGVVYAGNWIVGYNGTVGQATVKAETVGIADYAFYKCKTLQSLSGLSASNVRSIGRGAFYECIELDVVSLPRNLRRIEDYAFYNCISLFTVSVPSRVNFIGRSAFYNCWKLTEIDLAGSMVETIGDYAFYECISMQKADLGTRVKTIGSYAFYRCISLPEAVLPDSVETIGERAYSNCVGLKNLTLGSGVTSIGAYAFSECEKLKNVALPDSVETVGKCAFFDCKAIETLDLGKGLRTIGVYAFGGLENLTQLIFPESLVSLEGHAFRGCKGLTSVVLSDRIEEMGSHAFYGCDKATFYTQSEGLLAKWSDRWNSSYRPVVWGCALSSDRAYVVSVAVTEKTLSNVQAGVTAPTRLGYVFRGWSLSADSAAVAYAAEELANVPPVTVLYAVWEAVPAD